MAKSLLRIEARKMRSMGRSVREIAIKLGVAKSSASYWTRDIILTEQQLEKLQKNSLKGAELGRIRGALMQKKRRLQLIRKSKENGVKKLRNLSKREFFIAGIALYWAEGSKKTRIVEFCNSDPTLINLMIKWLKESFGIKRNELSVYVGINEIHKPREEIVKKYWSKTTKIPLKQFRKTSFKKVKNKKIYDNYERHFGTLTVKVLKSAKYYYKIIGLIHGLSKPG